MRPQQLCRYKPGCMMEDTTQTRSITTQIYSNSSWEVKLTWLATGATWALVLESSTAVCTGFRFRAKGSWNQNDCIIHKLKRTSIIWTYPFFCNILYNSATNCSTILCYILYCYLSIKHNKEEQIVYWIVPLPHLLFYIFILLYYKIELLDCYALFYYIIELLY